MIRSRNSKSYNCVFLESKGGIEANLGNGQRGAGFKEVDAFGDDVGLIGNVLIFQLHKSIIIADKINPMT